MEHFKTRLGTSCQAVFLGVPGQLRMNLRFNLSGECYNIKMRIFKLAIKVYINQWRKVIDNSTIEDALRMGLVGLLLLIAGIGDAIGTL
jgi:hypothetical protein